MPSSESTPERTDVARTRSGTHRAAADGGGHHSRPPRDRYPDALRAGALLVVVLGHWLATLPQLEGGRMVATEHLLTAWEGAGTLTYGGRVGLPR
jgi:hypothetical protein